MLEIFGAGFGRTGTLSLKLALEKLGFGPCHHMLELLEKPEQAPFWQRAAQGGRVDWEEVYADYRSSVDWPGARFWREVTAAYPGTKVILTVRDPESWYESARDSIYASVTEPPAGLAEQPAFAAALDMAVQVVWDGEFGGRFADKEHALKVFKEHNEAVAREVSSDRLLVFEVRQGWEPLCDFLGVPVPDEPFPRSNEREQFTTLVEEHTATGHP